MVSTLYSPGDEVPISGIYMVTHDPTHAQPHDVTAVKGERFPPCHGCGKHPRFVLRVPAKHLKEHPHFG